MLHRMCKHSPCRIGYCDRRTAKTRPWEPREMSCATGLKVRKIWSVSPTNVRSAAALGFMADAIYTTS
jgi:hypothetical protein